MSCGTMRARGVVPLRALTGVREALAVAGAMAAVGCLRWETKRRGMAATRGVAVVGEGETGVGYLVEKKK